MMHPYSLSYLLLLPLGACFPQVDRKEPVDTLGGIRAKMSWANLARGHQPDFLRGSSRWLRAPHPHALLILAKELQESGEEPAGFGLRFGRQDAGSEATSFFPAEGKKAGGLLGILAEELSGYSRKKGGFSFRFG
ncbi:orexigenic neuropeptide QRFP [Tamandua tetradactyla]|uniref:orexigenic neuropeptide QRFP n=1 Tax=Tamandua tetradactyla TaxID=48850 RepID=UPI00405488FF